MLSRPKHIPEKFSNPALSFKWDNRTAIRMREPDGAKKEIWEPILKINYRAQAALALACEEWIIWRLTDLIDTSDSLLRLEASWAALHSIVKVSSLDYEYEEAYSPVLGTKAESVLQLTKINMDFLFSYYSKKKFTISMEASNRVMFARHVLPKDCGFFEWYEDILKKLIALSPADPNIDKRAKSYDYSNELPIPRAWFESPASPIDSKKVESIWLEFFKCLNPKENPYLSSSVKKV